MKLTAKTVCVVVLALAVLLIVDAYLLVGREIDLLEEDSRQDAVFLSRALGTMIMDALESGEQQRAPSIVRKLNQSDQIDVRWFWEGESDRLLLRPGMNRAQLEKLASGEAISFQNRLKGRLHTYVAADLGPGRRGVLEVAESLSRLSAAERAFRIRVLVLFGSLLLTSVLLIAVVGAAMVGRPLAALIAHARRIGAGDLSGRLSLTRSDELGELASAMNQMSEDLAQAQERTREETEARIAAIRRLRHEDRLRTVGRLAAGIAHELGTPLNVISGRAAIIAAGQLPPRTI